jgi:hypothetical protein
LGKPNDRWDFRHALRRLVAGVGVSFSTSDLEKIMSNENQTFGQRAVGLSFNPSNDDAVAQRMASVAITEAQTAQMWAVKAITWKS